jgi:hypothetical protein
MKGFSTGLETFLGLHMVVDKVVKILSSVLVTNYAGSGLDERDYLLLIHTTSNYT